MDQVSATTSRESWSKFYKATLCLTYQSLGVIYGDLSTSPIYVYKSVFSGHFGIYEEDHEILGVLSLVFWTLTIFPLFKYIVLVLNADDNGEGGTFALYSLLCRQAKMGLLINYHSTTDDTTLLSSSSHQSITSSSLLIKEFFAKHRSSRVVLLLVVLLGTSMVISDGVLTPSMSVLSAVSGIHTKVEGLHENYSLVIACIILVGLFALQQSGTHRLGFIFAPILIAWLLCIGGIGFYNIIEWNPRVVYAVSPHYIYNFFKEDGRHAWRSLGGIVLCVTGAEAMFADLGHFSKLSIRIAFVGLVYPCLVFAYMGEAAYLTKNRSDLHASFYNAIPERIFWPVFIIATVTTIVGSQAIISGTFSIISQCQALRCFPRVKIIHTSKEIHGQIYIPEINWIMMVLCLAVVIGFRNSTLIGHAYGLAIISVMFITTCLMFLIISTVWNRNLFVALTFVLVFGSLELLYLSSCIAKVPEGGWLPLALSIGLVSLMFVWHYGTLRKDAFVLQNKVSLERLLTLYPGLDMIRVPGIAFVYSSLPTGVPPMFVHLVTNFPAFHEVVIFVTIDFVMVPKVTPAARFIVTRVGPSEFALFRCIVRYGYRDARDTYNFENELLQKVAELIRADAHREQDVTIHDLVHQSPISVSNAKKRARVPSEVIGEEEDTTAVGKLIMAKESGVTYMIGNTYVTAREASSIVKKVVINGAYGFLRRNCRQPATALGIPPTSSIEVGMLYHV